MASLKSALTVVVLPDFPVSAAHPSGEAFFYFRSDVARGGDGAGAEWAGDGFLRARNGGVSAWVGGVFIEFLHVSGLWAALRDRCPLQRTSPNAPDHASVVGSMVLAVLSGGNRYRHLDGMRGDAVMPDLLGMKKIISTDSLRRAVKDIAKHDQGQSWVGDLLLETLLPVVRQGPWILDVDSTVVTVCGKKSGSAVGL